MKFEKLPLFLFAAIMLQPVFSDEVSELMNFKIEEKQSVFPENGASAENPFGDIPSNGDSKETTKKAEKKQTPKQEKEEEKEEEETVPPKKGKQEKGLPGDEIFSEFAKAYQTVSAELKNPKSTWYKKVVLKKGMKVPPPSAPEEAMEIFLECGRKLDAELTRRNTARARSCLVTKTIENLNISYQKARKNADGRKTDKAVLRYLSNIEKKCREITEQRLAPKTFSLGGK